MYQNVRATQPPPFDLEPGHREFPPVERSEPAACTEVPVKAQTPAPVPVPPAGTTAPTR